MLAEENTFADQSQSRGCQITTPEFVAVSFPSSNILSLDLQLLTILFALPSQNAEMITKVCYSPCIHLQ